MKQFNLLVSIFLLLCSTTYAQVTTATLSGKVVDKEGPLIGATVVSIHEPSGTQQGCTTREDGRFTLPNLRIGGPYTLQVSYVGYRAIKYEDIELSLGQKLNLDIEMESEAFTTVEVTVLANEDPVLNGERTGASTNIDNDKIKFLPTISRSASDYTRLNPAAAGNSFGGRNDQFNNFSLDGSIFNNPFGLDAATPGGQTDAQPVSLDAIEEIQVSIAPYDVTQAGFTGAAINAVTKSGTNEYKGTVYGFYRNQNMTGGKVRGTEIFVPDLSQYQAGFSIGGPLIKDKLFFFANAEIDRREDLGSNFLADRDGLTGENVARVTAEDLELVSNALFDRFGYETGPYENFKHQSNSNKGLIKLDLNINNNNKLTATYNFLSAQKDKPAHPSAIGRRGPDLTTLQFQNSGYEIQNIIHSAIVELKTVMGNKFSNKLQVGYTAFRDSRTPFSKPFPVININKDEIRYIVAGHEPFSIYNSLDQDVLQLTNNFNIYLNHHTVTVGTSFERFDFSNSFNLGAFDSPTNTGGTFGPGFSSVQEFVDLVNMGEYDDEVAYARDLFESNSANNTWALAETNVGQWAIYGQDEWAVKDNLTLTIGLRADIPLYFNTPKKIQENLDRNGAYDPTVVYYDENGESITFDHTNLPKSTPLISPRLGVNWDVRGDQKMQVRGGTGLFTGRLPFVWIGNQVANPNFFFYCVTHPDFKFPQVWRTNIGYDQDIWKGLIASLDIIYTKDINGMMVRNYGLKPPTGTLNGVDNRPVYTADDRVEPYGNNAYVFTNVKVGYQFNTTLQLQKNWGKDFYTSLAYNYLDSKDASSIEAEISSDAYDRNPALGDVNKAVSSPSLYGNRHRITGVVFKKFSYANDKLATTISLFFQSAKGGRFSYTYSGDINNDGSGANDLIYIPTNDELQAMTFSGDAAAQTAQRTALAAYIAQDDYLKDRRGKYAEKYAILSPWASQWDFRLLQDINFPVGKRTNTVQLSLDILNLGNLFSSKLGVRQEPVNEQPIGLEVDSTGEPIYSFDTSLTKTYTDDFSLLSRWQMQLGLRYIF